MEIYELIDSLKAHLDEKERLDEVTKKNNKEIEEIKKALAGAMIDAESPTISRSGFIYSLRDKVRYSKRACDEESFFETLEDIGLGTLIKRTVNAASLSAAVKELVANNGDEMPEELDEYINTYQYYDIEKRKENNKVAKKAKGE